MRGFFLTFRFRVGVFLTLAVFLSLAVVFRSEIATAGIQWGIPERDAWLTTNGTIDARKGDTVRFRFFWYDPDVAGGQGVANQDKVKLHVCKDFSGLSSRDDGGQCYNELVGSDWITQLPTPYTELSYEIRGNEAPPCDVETSPECRFTFTFWVCDNGAGDPSKAECRNEKGCVTSGTDPSRPECLDSRGVPIAVGGGNIRMLGNNKPLANGQNITLPEDTSRTITLAGSDPDGDPITFEATNPARGTLDTADIINRTVVYTPNGNVTGNDSFTFTTRDRSISSDPATIAITVTPVNDAPRLTSYFVNKDAGEIFEPTTVKSVTAGANLTFEASWVEVENQLVKVHVCGTNALRPGSEATGGECVTPVASATSFAATSPATISYAVPLSDGGQDKTFFVFVCDNDTTAGRCSPAQFNEGRYHVNTAFPLTTTVSGSGSVASVPVGINCPTDCSEPYLDRTSVTLTATPAAGSVLERWTTTVGSGGCSGSAATCTVVMTEAKTVQAVFKPTHVLSLTLTGNGRVTSVPAGLDCRTGNTGTCAFSFAQDQVVTLTAAGDPGQTFTGWTPDAGVSCTGFGSCNVTVDRAHTIAAAFRPSFKISVLKDTNWNGLGSVQAAVVTAPTGGPTTGFTCSNFTVPCEGSYLQTTRLTLTANPSATAVFGGWSGGGCSGTGSCTVDLNANTTVTAQFRANYLLTITPVGNGTVSMTPVGSACGTNCGSYQEKTVVALGATAASGYIFTGWSGDSDCVDGSVTMNGPRSCTATFATAMTLTLQLRAGSSGSGNIVSTQIIPPAGQPVPPALNCALSPSTTTCSASFLQGTRIDLQQTPTGSPLSSFLGWSGGGCSGTGTSCTGITLATNTTVTFEYKATYTLTIVKTGNGTVNTAVGITPAIACGAVCAQPYSDGTSVTLNTINDPGFVFTDWTSADPGFNCSTTGPCVVTVDRHRTIRATFLPSFTLTIQKSGTGSGTVQTTTVTAPPGGPTTAMNCGATCGPISYLQGTSLTLSQTPTGSPLSVFTGWSGGGCSGTGNTCTLTLNANTTLTANFQATNTLTVTVVGPGRVTSTPTGITNCATSCNAAFADTANVSLARTPTGSGQFIRWELDCTGSSTCATVLSQARNVRAVFANRPVVSVGTAPLPQVGEAVAHTGATITDSDGDIVSYQWTPINCPGGGCSTIGPITITSTGNATAPGPNFTPTQAGSYVWTLTATDATGATGTGTLTIQTATRPVTTITGCPITRDSGGASATCASEGGAGYSSRASTANFTFSATDPETPAGPFTYTFQLFRGTSTIPIRTGTCSGCGAASYGSTDLLVGFFYTFEVVARDNTALADLSPAKFTWTVELNTPPVPTITNKFLGFDSFQNSNVAIFSFSAVDSPPDNLLALRCEYNKALQSADCASLNSGQTSADWPLFGLSSGSHELRVRATDSLGAQGWSAPFKWYVPLITMTGGPSGNTIDTAANFTFDGRDDDGDVLSYECQAGTSATPNANAWQSCGTGGSGAYSFSTGTNGTYHFFVRAWDGGVNSGNVSTVVSRTWTLTNVAVNPQAASGYVLGSSLALGSNGLGVIAAGAKPNGSSNTKVYRCLDRACGSTNTAPSYGPHMSPALKIDTAGNIHVSSMEASQNGGLDDPIVESLYYGFFNGATWSSTRIDLVVDSSEHTSLVLRADGTPLIFYSKNVTCGINPCTELKVAYPVVPGTGTGCLVNSWRCATIDSIVNPEQGAGLSAHRGPNAGVAADYNFGDTGPRVVYAFARTLRFATCIDANCSSSTKTTLMNNYDYGAAGRNLAYIRTGGSSQADHILRVRSNSCNSTGCNWEYVRSPGNTLTFGTVIGDVTGGRHDYVAMTTDTNGFLVFAVEGITLKYCKDENCSSLGTQFVVNSGTTVAGLDIKIGSDNIPRFVYSTGAAQGSSFVLCRNAYCAP